MISAIILSKNEEDNIIDCVKSVSFCDEIIIVDDISSDKTIEVVKKLKNPKITILQHTLDNDFSIQRNFGLTQAKGEWVLFVDADERVSAALAYEISNAIVFSSDVNGFYIKRRDNIWGRELKYGESGSIKLLRLGKKEFGKWEGKVHEVWKIKGKRGLLNNFLLHYPHDNIKEFLKEVNFYTSLRAEELYKKGAKTDFMSIFLYPLGKFLLNFLLRRGFLDGIAGLIVAIMMSFHSFLVRGKLWLLSRKDE